MIQKTKPAGQHLLLTLINTHTNNVSTTVKSASVKDPGNDQVLLCQNLKGITETLILIACDSNTIALLFTQLSEKCHSHNF